MKITILSRSDAKFYSTPNSVYMISITDPGSPSAFFFADYDLILRLSFIDAGIHDTGPLVINKGQARLLAGMIHKAQKNDIAEVVIHCEAGMSRSAGVARAFCNILQLDDDVCFEKGRFPNVEVMLAVQYQYGLHYT
jgi:predicted protein tyrosine phosphatase